MQYVSLRWAMLKTRLIYRPRLRACGKNSAILRPLFWTPECLSIGSEVVAWPGCRIEGIDASGGDDLTAVHIVIGDGVTIQQNCHITAGGQLSIGAGTTVLCDVVITDMDHRYEQLGVRVVDQPISVRETSIGANCFIGAGAKIMAGTRLGAQCVVGANTVVRGEFPSRTVIAGSPARVVKRYDEGEQAWIRVRGVEVDLAHGGV